MSVRMWSKSGMHRCAYGVAFLDTCKKRGLCTVRLALVKYVHIVEDLHVGHKKDDDLCKEKKRPTLTIKKINTVATWRLLWHQPCPYDMP